MVNVYFMHQIKHTKAHGNEAENWSKGIVVKSDQTKNNLEEAKQAYHAYYAAYAYGHEEYTDYVQCVITNLSGQIIPGYDEVWFESTNTNTNTNE